MGYKTMLDVVSFCPWTEPTTTEPTCCYTGLRNMKSYGVFLCNPPAATDEESVCTVPTSCSIWKDLTFIVEPCDNAQYYVELCTSTICMTACCILFDDFNRADSTDLNAGGGIMEGVIPYTAGSTLSWSGVDTDVWVIDGNTIKTSQSNATLCLSYRYPWDNPVPDGEDTLYNNTCPYIGFEAYGLTDGDTFRVYISPLSSAGIDYCIEFVIGSPGKVRIVWEGLANEYTDIITDCDVTLTAATWHTIEVVNGLIKVNGDKILNYGDMLGWKSTLNSPPYATIADANAILGTGSLESASYVKFDDISVKKLKRKYEYNSNPATVSSVVSTCDVCPECAWFNGVQPDTVVIDLAGIVGPLSVLNTTHVLESIYATEVPVIYTNACIYKLTIPYNTNEVNMSCGPFVIGEGFTVTITLTIGHDGHFTLEVVTDLWTFSPYILCEGWWAKAGGGFETFLTTSLGVLSEDVLGDIGCLQTTTELDILGYSQYWECDAGNMEGPFGLTTDDDITATIYNIV